MTIRHIIRSIREAVEPLYGPNEAESIARMVVSEKLHYNLSQLVVHYDDECEIAEMERIVDELRNGRPVQYVLGKAEFCDMEFSVAEGVLIPRPETEELAYRIVGEAKRGARILDIGTGTGVLPMNMMEEFREKLGFYSCTVPTFEQYVLAQLISDGSFERHINRIRRQRRKNK